MNGRRQTAHRRHSLDLAPTPYMTRQASSYTPPGPTSYTADMTTVTADNTTLTADAT